MTMIAIQLFTKILPVVGLSTKEANATLGPDILTYWNCAQYFSDVLKVMGNDIILVFMSSKMS